MFFFRIRKKEEKMQKIDQTHTYNKPIRSKQNKPDNNKTRQNLPDRTNQTEPSRQNQPDRTNQTESTRQNQPDRTNQNERTRQKQPDERTRHNQPNITRNRTSKTKKSQVRRRKKKKYLQSIPRDNSNIQSKLNRTISDYGNENHDYVTRGTHENNDGIVAFQVITFLLTIHINDMRW